MMNEKYKNLQKNPNKIKENDRKLIRHTKILQLLSDNLLPTSEDLQNEFNLKSVRTVQRDIKELSLFFPIEKNKNKQYHFIEGFSLNKATLKNDEMLFVYLALSQIKNINENFEKTTHSIFSKLLTPKYTPAYHIKETAFEKIDIDSSLLNTIEDAIAYQNRVYLEVPNRQFLLEPYKVVSFDGIWYLFGKDLKDKKVKTVFIHQISKLEIKKEKYELDKPVDKILDNVHSAWFEDGNSMEVVIKVKANIAFNFELKSILPSQEILKKFDDGSLLIKFTVSTEEDIDNIIKSWIPDIELIKPKFYREKLKKEIKEYLKLYEN